MILPNSEQYLEDLKAAQDLLNRNLSAVQRSFSNKGFSEVAAKGFNLTNVKKDLNENVSLIVPLGTPVDISTGESSVPVYSNIPMQPEYGAKGVKYINPVDPSQVIVGNPSTTVATDRADGDKSQSRWITRCIFRFRKEDYGYDRCVYEIPVQYLMEGIVGDEGRYSNTLNNYPYPEEIIMISKDTEKNFIHFINVQYEDGHCGHFNGRDYNFMCVFDRTKYGVINSKGDAYEKYTSVYTNNLDDSLAFYGVGPNGGYLYLPMPDRSYGDDLLNTLWDCRVIWRKDSINRSLAFKYMVNTATVEYDYSQQVQDKVSGINWAESNTQTFGDAGVWKAVCYGTDKFVAVAQTNQYLHKNFAYSVDGKSWTLTANGISEPRQWTSVCYGGGKYVAASMNSDTFAYSIDGITWTEFLVNRGYMVNCTSICYGNGKYVMALIGTTFGYSTDGVTWSFSSTGLDYTWSSVCCGNNKYVAFAHGTECVYSTDGIVWSRSSSGIFRADWTSVCYGGTRYVATYRAAYDNDQGSVLYSIDGINWTSTEPFLKTTCSLHSVCYGDNKYVAVGTVNGDSNASAVCRYSVDGIIWTNNDQNFLTGKWRSVGFGKNTYVAVASDLNPMIAYSSDEFHTEIIKKNALAEATYLNSINDRYIISRYLEPFSILSNYRDTLLAYSNIDTVRSIDHRILSGVGKLNKYPDYNISYSLIRSTEASWRLTDIPNRFIRLNSTTLIGFSYLNITSDFKVSRKTQITYNLFNNLLQPITPINTSNNPTNYPCDKTIPNIFNSEILDIIDNGTDSEFIAQPRVIYVYTTTAKYKVTINLISEASITLQTEKIADRTEIGPAVIIRISATGILMIRNSDNTVFLDALNDSTYVKNPYGLTGPISSYFIGRYHLVDVQNTSVNGRCDCSISKKFSTLPLNGTSDDAISGIPSYNNIKMHDGKLNIVENASGNRKISMLREKYTLSGDFLVNPK